MVLKLPGVPGLFKGIISREENSIKGYGADENRCMLQISANQSIPHDDVGLINWNVTVFDPLKMHDTTNAYQINIYEDGYYMIVVHGGFAANATGIRFMALNSNPFGGGDWLTGVSWKGFSEDENEKTLTAIQYFNAGSNFGINTYQGSGGALNFLKSYAGSGGNLAYVLVMRLDI